jgi:hypothetical protein
MWNSPSIQRTVFIGLGVRAWRGMASPWAGTISGSQAVALKACIAAIDEALSGSLLRVPAITTH